LIIILYIDIYDETKKSPLNNKEVTKLKIDINYNDDLFIVDPIIGKIITKENAKEIN
jgi:hypothetical protein